MMIPIQWTTQSGQKNLPELLEKLKREGGSVVEYRYVFSAIIFSQVSTKLVWVPEHRSHSLHGLIISIPTMLLGWWSIQGFFWTLGVIISNLLGGINVTELFTTPPDDDELSAEIIRKIERQRRIQQWSFVGVLLIILAVIIIFFVAPCLK